MKPITELLKPILVLILILIGIAIAVGIAKSEPYSEKPAKRIINVTACAKHAFVRPDFIQCAVEKVCASDVIQNPVGTQAAFAHNAHYDGAWRAVNDGREIPQY